MQEGIEAKRKLLPAACAGVAMWHGASKELSHGQLVGQNFDESWQWQVKAEGEIWLWLNGSGNGLLWGERDRIFLRPGLFALTGGDRFGHWVCRRSRGDHDLQIVRMRVDWLRERVGTSSASWHPGLRQWLQRGGAVSFCGLMGIWEKELSASLRHARSREGGSTIWAEVGILHWAAQRLCQGPVATDPAPALSENDPVAVVLRCLRSGIDEPLDLEKLGKQVGVSPHHLSRMVKAKTGTTLQWHLRKMRVEHACELFASGRSNVTETAYACGYQSLSHFAKAFREETGYNPKQWLQQRGLAASANPLRKDK